MFRVGSVGLSFVNRRTANCQRYLNVKKLFSTDTVAEIQLANSKSSGLWILKETTDKGWGIFATKQISALQLMFKANCLHKTEGRNSHSVQTGWNSHVHMDLPARFINHSCDANVGIVDNDSGAFDFVALQDISEGDELTWDYGAAEFESISIDQCLCGSPKCRGSRIGFKDSYLVIREQYGEHYSKYLRSYQES